MTVSFDIRDNSRFGRDTFYYKCNHCMKTKTKKVYYSFIDGENDIHICNECWNEFDENTMNSYIKKREIAKI